MPAIAIKRDAKFYEIPQSPTDQWLDVFPRLVYDTPVRDPANVPLGPGLPFPVPTRVVLPRLVDAPPLPTTTPPPAKVVRRDEPPNQGELSVEIVYTGTRGGTARYSIPEMGPNFVDLTLRAAQQILGIPAVAKPEKKPMDLGDLLGALEKGAQIYSTIRGTTQPLGSFGPISTTPVSNPIGDTVRRAVDVPMYDVIPETEMKGMVWNPRANCGAGKWVKRRRRRKILASARDIRDLGALGAVLSPAQLKTWIATH